jgi:hypothetical protein
MRRCCTPFNDILRPAPSGLDNLIMGPATSVDAALTETHRDIKAELRHLEAFQLPVPAMRRGTGVAVGRFLGEASSRRRGI